MKVHEPGSRHIVAESESDVFKLGTAFNKHPISFSLGWGERRCEEVAEGFLGTLCGGSEAEAFLSARIWLQCKYALSDTRAEEIGKVLLEALQGGE